MTAQCITFLEENLTTKHVAVIFEECIFFGELDVVKLCKDVIAGYSDEVITSAAFLTIEQDTLKAILDMDELNASEVSIFQACIKWAKAKIDANKEEVTGGKMRDVLGKALYSIRFTEMTSQDFGNIVLDKNILNKDEENLCFRYFSREIKPELPFNTKPRDKNWISRYTYVDSKL